MATKVKKGALANQRAAISWLKENYAHHECLWQDVCKDRIYEAYNVFSKTEDGYKPETPILIYYANGKPNRKDTAHFDVVSLAPIEQISHIAFHYDQGD